MSPSFGVAHARAILPFLSLSLLAAPAGAQMLAFDFDDDGDPETIVSEVTADVGTFVHAYLVLQQLPVEHPYLRGVQFGLDLTDGLRFVGMSVPYGDALYMQDGPAGIAVAYGEAVHLAELPMFVMRFVLAVTEGGVQSVEVVPSTGWDTEFDSFVLVLSDRPNGPQVTYQSDLALTTQRRGYVNNATPVLEKSWSAVKRQFARREEVR